MRTGALDLSELLEDIQRPELECPDFSSAGVSRQRRAVPEDLFAVRKRAAWKEAQPEEARCDLSPNKLRITNRGGVFFISLWKRSVYGRTLSEIKNDESMVGHFADSMAPLVRSVLGSFLSPSDFAVVTTPKRRHLETNFATLVASRMASLLGLPFFEDCALAPSRHRVGAVFSANNIPPQRNVIVYDDFVTTGQTLVAMQDLLVSLGKNCVFFASVNNKSNF